MSATLAGALAEILSARLHARPVNAALLPARDDLAAWQDLVKLAHSERVSPLVYITLKDTDYCPVDILDLLRGIYYQTVRDNTRLFLALDQILADLKREGVNVILLKGAAMVDNYYHNLGLRPLTDIDLLIKSSDLDTAVGLLQKKGFIAAQNPYMNGDLDFHNELSLSLPGLRPPVELHWSLLRARFYKRVINNSVVWNTAIPIKGRKDETLGLSLEAMIVYQSAHLILKHSGENLLWFYDIALLVMENKEKINWDLVVTYSRDWHLIYPIRLVFREITRLFAVPVPTVVMTQVDTFRPSIRERIEFSRISAPPAFRYLALLLEMRNLSNQVQYLHDALFPPASLMIERFQIKSRWLLPFYYLARLVLGLRKNSSFH